MRIYLGLRYALWALIVWIAVAGTFGVLLLFRLLASYKEEDELFMPPAEIRNTLDDYRNITRMTVAFGVASAVSLVLIIAGWSAGWL